MISQTEENYLKTLFALTRVTGEASVNELSKQLNIKMPTVNSMMKRLAEKDLVIYESYKPLKLTAKGQHEAALILRKHRLTEMFLVQKMGFGWEEVHPIAEQIEHIQSPAFFNKMDALLGFPKYDPHGSPIPDIYGVIEADNYVKLSTCSVGQQVTFRAVGDSSEDFLRFLNQRDLALGSTLTILGMEAFDRSMTVLYGDNIKETFSHLVCEKILIAHLSD
ncbi:metal-dependent transcriptional regulator [Sphingobacterium sp. Mn56C]|uniref:metal-dependent transcriptional regulator n=1 Tax=Sphingobacterium sp. Mn56C TaxID=3395261 RepID=UPI003BDAA694